MEYDWIQPRIEVDPRVPNSVLSQITEIMDMKGKEEDDLLEHLAKKYPDVDPETVTSKVLSARINKKECAELDYQNEKNEVMDEIKNKAHTSIQNILYSGSEVWLPLECKIDDMIILYGEKNTFVKSGPIKYGGGRRPGTNVSSAYSRSIIEVNSTRFPTLKKIVFGGALPLQKGDLIKTKVFCGYNISKACNYKVPSFEKEDKKYVMVEPHEEEGVLQIEKIVNGESVAKYRYK